ncbi:MAG: alpha/beta fold hydrolase [Verrucomicrobiota bacterium]
MPLLASSTYRTPWGLTNGHLQTIMPVIFRRVAPITCERQRIETPDGDFLDLDWNRDHCSESLVIITHGLEGNSANASVQGMATAFHRAGWDTLAWNLRGCSGEMNRLLRTYHSGAWEDLQCVIDQAAGAYRDIALVGFSIGGNLTLKYLGDRGSAIHPSIKGAVAFSAPCDLASSALVLESRINRIYMNHFMRDLHRKIREKAVAFPEGISMEGLALIRTFREFDGTYTAPLNGFLSAEDYWARASSKPSLHGITVPTLLVNALNDPFLGPECFPREEAEANPHFYLELPKSGGHLGFISLEKEYWSETRAVEFFRSKGIC